MTKRVSFSHRPQAGISTVIVTDNNKAYLAAAFLHKNDKFSRKKARLILLSRVEAKKENKNPRFVLEANVTEGVDSRTLMRNFRPVFKPDYHENDNTFHVSLGGFGGVGMLAKATREQSWEKVASFFHSAVEKALTK